MYSVSNDIDNNIFPTSGKNLTIKPTFWLENDELHGPTEGWLEPVGSRIKLALLWQNYFGETIGESRERVWRNNILPLPYQPLKQYQGKVDYTLHEMWKDAPQNALKNFKAGNIQTFISLQMTPRSELRQYGIKLSRKLLAQIKKLSEENGAHFIIFKEERPWEAENTDSEKAFIVHGEYYETSMRQYNDNLNELFKGFEYYSIPLGIEIYTINPDDVHLNQNAINKLMRELSLIISRKEYFN